MAKPFNVHEVSVQVLVAALDDPASYLGRSAEHHTVVDVGASNCRVGLVAKGSEGIHDIMFVKIQATSTRQLKAVLEGFVRSVGPHRLAKVKAASANGPAPAFGMVIGPIANYEGATMADRYIDLRAMPPELFPPHNTVALNDLEAGAHGVIATSVYGRFSTTFAPMWTAADTSRAAYTGDLGRGNAVILAPGTGLGAAAIQFHAHTRTYTVMPLEFGHTAVAAPAGGSAFLDFMGQVFYKGKYPAEYDDLCAGRGLERAYEFHDPKHRRIGAADVSRLAATGDTTALRALAENHEWLVRLGSQLAMGLQPRTIVLLGDNVVKNSFFYERPGEVAAMKRQFHDHSIERLGFMSRVHVVRQVERANMNLVGCAYACETMPLVPDRKRASKL